MEFLCNKLKESTFSYFNKKVPLASDKKSDDMSKKPIQRFAILFAKDARLKSKIVEFVNLKVSLHSQSSLLFLSLTCFMLILVWL